MKVKMIKKDAELIIDYVQEKNVYLLRYKVLKFLSEKYKGNLTVFINTNNKRNKAPNQNAEKILNKFDLDFRCEVTEKKRRALIDLNWLFKKNEKEKDMSENLILLKMTEEDLENLYDDLLQYYDYGVGCDAKKSLDGIFPLVKADPSKVLFNKNYFSSTLYDSTIFYRMRMDSPYEDLVKFLEKYKD